MTGTCEAVMWDGVDDSFAVCAVGSPVRVAGAFSVDSRYGATLTLRALRAAASRSTSRPTCTTPPRSPSTRWWPTSVR